MSYKLVVIESVLRRNNFQFFGQRSPESDTKIQFGVLQKVINSLRPRQLLLVYLVVAIVAYTDRSGLFTAEVPHEPCPEHSTVSAMGTDLAAALSLDKTNAKPE